MRNFRTLVLLLMIGFVSALSLPAFGEEITIVGTGSGESVLKAVGEAFTKENPTIQVTIPNSIGSGGGIKAVGTDEAAIGRVAREIKEKEKPYELVYLPVVQLPIVVFTNKNVPVRNLSPQQICEIYSGKITNWKDVGGADAEIRVVRREEGDSSLDVLLKLLPGFKDITITPKAKTTLSDPETVELVQEKENTIAFGTYPNTLNMNVQVLEIDGKTPTSAGYPYVGTLALIFKEKNKVGTIEKFVNYATSGTAAEIIKKAGAYPL